MLGAIDLLNFFPAEDYSSRDTVSKKILEALKINSNNVMYFFFGCNLYPF